MLKGVNNIDYRHLFTFSNNRTRSNGWKLELKRFNTSQCGNFFTYKIAPIWNRLPAEAVNSASVEQFKIELDKVIDTLILSRATKGNSNPRLKGNRKGIIVKGKEFYIPILNTFPTR